MIDFDYSSKVFLSATPKYICRTFKHRCRQKIRILFSIELAGTPTADIKAAVLESFSLTLVALTSKVHGDHPFKTRCFDACVTKEQP